MKQKHKLKIVYHLITLLKLISFQKETIFILYLAYIICIFIKYFTVIKLETKINV